MDEQAKRKTVYRVFESLAEGYDAANDRISLGLQRKWKQLLTDRVRSRKTKTGQTSYLDVCCGTGDIAITLAKQDPEAAVTGMDFSPAMLEVAKEKSRQLDNLTWVRADATALPFADGQFRAATISFGLRNTTDYKTVLAEMTRVVAPGGWVYVLDSCVVDNPVIRPFYRLYFRFLMPYLGGGAKHLREYRWLWRSTEEFLRKDALTALFRETGLQHVRSSSRMFGACVLVEGQKAGTGPESSDSCE